MNNLVVILIAVSFHYIAEYMSEHPCYECPYYCDADHTHFKCEETSKQNKELKNGLDTKQLDSLSIDILDGREISENYSHPI